MSLVEQALKKLQRMPFSSAVAPDAVVGKVIDVPEEAFLGAKAARSNKRITVDRAKLRAMGLLPPENFDRRLAGEYRQIKRPLLAAALGQGREPVVNGRLIMVTSALPGDGKTFTSMNLALSMAKERDISVLLVDADVAKPHISRTFGVEKEPGLNDALRDQALDIESCVIDSDIEGLSILPSGRVVEDATELLASNRMERILARLATVEPNRVILFDTSPLLLTNESKVISNVVGQVVIVVRAGYTTHRAVGDAVAAIAENKPVSLILNQSEDDVAAPYYGYGEYGSSSSAS